MTRRGHLATFLFVAGLMAGPLAAQDKTKQTPGSVGLLARTQESLVKVARKIQPSVVSLQIEARSNSPRSSRGIIEPLPGPRDGAGQGSGVIIDADGDILTNAHVIRNARRIRVRLSTGEVFPASLKGIDLLSDLAVVHVNAGRKLPAAKFTKADSIRAGQLVIAVGNPFGLHNTMTLGVVSAARRSLPHSNFMRQSLAGLEARYGELIQTDAAINPGNSGGPLVNINGELIGINVLIFTRTRGGQGVGFAIPAETVRHHLPALRKGEAVKYGWFGVVPADLTGDLAKTFELEPFSGVLLNRVVEDDPADKGGLRTGMVVTHLDGREVTNTEQFIHCVKLGTPGETMKVSVVGLNGKKSTVTVTLGERQRGESVKEAEAEIMAAIENEVERKEPAGYWRGLTVRGLSNPERLRGEKGVVITRVLTDSPAGRAGLQRSMRIEQVGPDSKNLKTIDGLDSYGKLTDGTKGIVLLRVRDYGYVALPSK